MKDYVERMKEVFLLNECDNDRMQVSYLLTYIGEEGYETLKSLTAPENPNTLKFDVLTASLIEHFDPNPTPMSERYQFFRMNQGKLSVAQWKAKLAAASVRCDFGDYRADAVRDQFIFGLADSSVRESLMSEEKTKQTLDLAYKRAISKEKSVQENRIFGGTASANAAYQTSSRQHNRNTKQQSKQQHRQQFPQTSRSSSNHNSSGNSNAKVCVKCKLSSKINKCTSSGCMTECFHCKLKGHTTYDVTH